MVVERVGHRVEVAAGEQVLEPFEELRVDRQRVGERAVDGTGLLDQDLAVALDDVGFDFGDVIVDQRLDRLLTGEDPARASRTQVGQSESVRRGHPNCGFERCRCFSSGAGAHFGWKVPPSKCLLMTCIAGHAARAPYVSASSTGLHTFIRVKPPRSTIPTAWPTVEIPVRPEVNGRCRMAAQRHFHIGERAICHPEMPLFTSRRAFVAAEGESAGTITHPFYGLRRACRPPAFPTARDRFSPAGSAESGRAR